MKGLAGVHMFLDPGGSRELHWHAIAAEWAYVIDGQCQTVVLDPSGQTEVNNYKPGDLWFFPKGHGHSIQFEEITLKHWVETSPKYLVSNNFADVPDTTIDALQQG